MTPAAAAVPGAGVVDHRFRAMGCDVRIAAADPGRDPAGLAEAVRHAEVLIHVASARLTRFDGHSELRRLGVHPQHAAAISPLLAHALQVALDAAAASGGLLDPTLARPLASSGYAATWDPARRADLHRLLALAPPRRPAQPARGAAWRQVAIDRRARTATGVAGLHFDLGATAKGLIADLALRLLGPVAVGFIDAGGDLAIATTGDQEVVAEDPFGRAPVALTASGPCGVATSSIAGRCWIGPDGPAHHVLDPSTGQPAFTGVVQATAAAKSTAEAERLAGQALLSGPQAGARLLTQGGGLLVLDDATTIRLQGAFLR